MVERLKRVIKSAPAKSYKNCLFIPLNFQAAKLPIQLLILRYIILNNYYLRNILKFEGTSKECNVKIYPISNSLYKNNYTRLNCDNSVEKHALTPVSKDLFEKSGKPQKEVAFEGNFGAAAGAITGEVTALFATKILTTPPNPFWPVAILAISAIGMAFLGNYIENKIENIRKTEKQKTPDEQQVNTTSEVSE